MNELAEAMVFLKGLRILILVCLFISAVLIVAIRNWWEKR